MNRRIDGTIPLNPGLLRTQLVVQERVIVQNSFGEDLVSWRNVATLWVQELAMSGRELEAVQQIWAEARFKLRTHFPVGFEVKREMRGMIGTRILDILDANDPDGARRELVIIAKEMVQ